RRQHTRSKRDWSSDVCSSDLEEVTNHHFKTVTFEKDGYIRRTPCIVSSNVLIQAFSNKLDQTKPIKNETIFSSTLITEVDNSDVNKFNIRPFVTGMQDFVLDNDDPLPTGFLLK